ncbi:hypothetical protein GCM10007047_05000 [Cerasicoccus arenae]|uniref:Uncharacterized protein n=2 Tax=Cerasicoccus arenae TaxID=424488 RepID=A0A8J3D999_9BACT|nr:hypothetical protein GCM10007047_05000 [Cerasicoccus arenae]
MLVFCIIIGEMVSGTFNEVRGATAIESWNVEMSSWVGQTFTEEQKNTTLDRWYSIYRGDEEFISSVKRFFKTGISVFGAIVFFQMLSFIFLLIKPKINAHESA